MWSASMLITRIEAFGIILELVSASLACGRGHGPEWVPPCGPARRRRRRQPGCSELLRRWLQRSDAPRFETPTFETLVFDAPVDIAAAQQAAASKLPGKPKVESVWCLLRADGTSGAGSVDEHALIVDYHRCVALPAV